MDRTEAAPSLELVKLSVSYGVVPALRGVSLKVTRGQVVTIIGGNGAGKSTTMKCVSGLLAQRDGQVRLHNEDVSGLQPDELVRRGLSLVPEGRRLFGSMTVRENLELGAYCRDDAKAIAIDMDRVLAAFPDLCDRLGSTAGSLSGGQQQMVAVARALMSEPKVLLLDEPTIGLAPAIVDKIAQAIVEVRKAGVDILLVEQNAEIALEIADYGYVLENGSIVMHGPADQLRRNEEVQRAYLGL
jgi:branched-chain amino acid transport system ATP-binding protein